MVSIFNSTENASKGGGELFNSSLGKYYTKLSIGDYSRPTPFAQSTWSKKKIIILPLPNVLKDDTTVGYDNINLDIIGDILNKDEGGALSKTAIRAGVGLVATVIPNFVDSVARGSQSATLGDAIDSERVATAAGQLYGIAPNPNATVAFTGPELRSFSFSWSLQPRNSSESAAIKRIITILKQSSLPENYSAGSGAILKYPSLTQLNFYPWDTSGNSEWGWGDDSIIKIKKCFMSSVNVNYAPSNIPAFFEGTSEPVVIELTIDFKEIEYMLSNDWGGAQATTTLGDKLSDLLPKLTSDTQKGLIDDVVSNPLAVLNPLFGPLTIGKYIFNGSGAADDPTQAIP